MEAPTRVITTLQSITTNTPSFAITPTSTITPLPGEVRFAVIGDYGEGNQAEADIAVLIDGWNPDIILTVGDNNYPSGSSTTIDDRIGQYYHGYISPYNGMYGTGAEENRFYPTLGNHDWIPEGAQPYLDYFILPGNERYYDFTWGPVHFFAIDSDEHEPEGVGRSSLQAAWLQAGLAASTSAWNVVYFHHPPYSSGYHGSTDWMRWPFAAWGADAVLSGHDHTYERLLVDGIPYFVNGVGGGGIYEFVYPLSQSQYRYNAGYGAMLVTATEKEMRFEFFSRWGELRDTLLSTRP
jgi:tartrate-resistant acid phosphatase type 5